MSFILALIRERSLLTPKYYSKEFIESLTHLRERLEVPLYSPHVDPIDPSLKKTKTKQNKKKKKKKKKKKTLCYFK